ncbi:MAG: hypothetical protein IPK26_13680 [Planctomycetes bacterium]|nr:hypothetical protein [Planctomycetota bacterium]
MEEAYIEAFRKGRYEFVVSGEKPGLRGADATPGALPCLVVGCTANGVAGAVHIFIDSDPRIADAAESVAAKRGLWLNEIVWDFNSRPLEERRQLAQKRSADARWAEQNLPRDIEIDEQRWLSSVVLRR